MANCLLSVESDLMCLYIQDKNSSRCALDKWGMGRDARDRDSTPDDSRPTSRACLEFHHFLEIGKHALEVDLHPRRLLRSPHKSSCSVRGCPRAPATEVSKRDWQNVPSNTCPNCPNYRKSCWRNSTCLSMLLQPRRSGFERPAGRSRMPV